MILRLSCKRAMSSIFPHGEDRGKVGGGLQRVCVWGGKGGRGSVCAVHDTQTFFRYISVVLSLRQGLCVCVTVFVCISSMLAMKRTW